MSASRNEGSSLTSNEAGSISDAKLAKFFGLNKKTPQEIAIERHARRDAVAVQGLRSVSCRVSNASVHGLV